MLAGAPDEPQRAGSRRADSQGGSAAVEFVLVAPLICLLLVGCLQVVLTAYARSVAVAAAAEGARVAGESGVAAGERRTRALLAGQVADAAVREVRGSWRAVDGLPVAEVAVVLAVPLLGRVTGMQMQVAGHSARVDR